MTTTTTKPIKRTTVSSATILCMRIIHDVIIGGLDSTDNPERALEETLPDPAEFHAGAIQTIQIRISTPVWGDLHDDHSADGLHKGTNDGTCAEALVRLVQNIYGMNVADDIASFLLNPSLISDSWA